jgi:hypothetical protein
MAAWEEMTADEKAGHTMNALEEFIVFQNAACKSRSNNPSL